MTRMPASGGAVCTSAHGRRRHRLRRRAATALALVLGTASAWLAPAEPAAASQVPATLPTANPANFTPNVESGEVDSIWQVGSRVIIAGTFTSVSNATQNGGTTYVRNRLAAFNATTGVVDTAFNPNASGNVSVVIPSADPGSVYVAGSFTSIGGVTRSRVARINVADGSVVSAFNAGTINAQVRDLRLVNGRLYIAGDFATVAGQSRSRLAAVDPTTGALHASPNLPFAGTHNGGGTNILKIDVTPDGGRVLAIGNFTSVAGQDRHQIALIDTAAEPDALSAWQTSYYDATCASVFSTFMRDLDISPDGRFAIVTTTGAYRPPPSSCDTNARFELTGETANLQPTWVNYTGGDTSYAVEIANGVAFVGGHMRWANNPFAGDQAGPGAIPREGIQALDVTNGLPFSWNPGRARGVGVFDFHVTAQGVWAGSDTLTWAGEQRRRLAFFPFAGGTTVPADVVGTLPNDVFTLGRVSGSGLDDVQRRFFSGTGAPGSTTVFPGTTDWRNVRGAFMVGGTLFSFHANGTVQRRTFDGATFGAPTVTAQYSNNIAADLPNVTGLAYDTAQGRIYYTMAGQNALFYRSFTAESTAVGAQRFTVTGSVAGLQPSRVQGMFISGGSLHFADASTGNLLRIGFGGGSLAGTATVVDGTVDWRGRALFVWNGTPAGGGGGGNTPPNATFTSSCSGLTCTFDAGGSGDPDGSITAYAWNFGDGSTANGVNANRAYAAAGTYTVTLTVTDDDGATDQASAQVDPSQPQGGAVTLRATASSNVNTASASVVVPASVQPGDQLLLFVTINRAGTIGTPAGWTLRGQAADGSPDVTSFLLTRTAAGGTGGSTVTVPISSRSKTSLVMMAYSGAAAVSAFVSSVETGTAATHASPSVAVATNASTVVSYWVDKTAGNTGWTLPGNVTERVESLGSGSGQITAVAGDSTPVAVGSWPGATATSSVSSGKAIMWSVVVPPA
jgi:PKD repeat protein